MVPHRRSLRHVVGIPDDVVSHRPTARVVEPCGHAQRRYPDLFGIGGAFGVALVIIAIASYGVATNLAVPLTQAYGPVPIFWRCQMLSLALTAPFGVWGVRDSTFAWRPVGAVVLLGVFGTAMAFVMMTSLGARVGATRSSTVTYLEAIFALGIGVAIRNDKVVALQIAGCAVLIGGAWLASRRDG
jgi:drug/metabolite transporter (DMT)-like permease